MITDTDTYVAKTCRPGEVGCCRYLTMGGGGWACAKLDPALATYLDERVELGSMRAVGDNCPGRDLTGILEGESR